MAHKYLNKLGIKSTDPVVFNTEGERGRKRAKKRIKMHANHGFDDRETWSMDYTLYTWLYEHIMWYKKHAPVDMTFHHIDIPSFDEENLRTDHEKTICVSQLEAINIVLKNLKFVLTDEHMWNEHAGETIKRGQYIMHVLAQLMPLMWW